MTNMDTVHVLNQDLVQSQSLVAVFAGGSGGIGALSLKALAATVSKVEGKGLRAYIIGRNASTAQEIIAECRELCPTGQYHFISINDYALIKDVDAACEELIQAETLNAALANEHARIDYLMLSHGGSLFLPRQGLHDVPSNYSSRVLRFVDTKEGIDATMARFYYSRMASITKLLPLLLESSLPATVVSVYAAGMEGKLYVDDLSLRLSSHYSYFQARSHIDYMHTCFFEELAKKHAGQLRLIHIFPGLVVHKGMYSKDNPWWLRFVFTKVLPSFGMDMDLKEVGHRMVALASPSKYPALPCGETTLSKSAVKGTNGEPGSGAYALNEKGESAYPEKRYAGLDKQALREKVCIHTNLALKQIRAGGVFEG
jgi:NAD(P)-dependent dehydrogenase (short-subunit alcohol dehydrogenase family)